MEQLSRFVIMSSWPLSHVYYVISNYSYALTWRAMCRLIRTEAFSISLGNFRTLLLTIFFIEEYLYAFSYFPRSYSGSSNSTDSLISSSFCDSVKSLISSSISMFSFSSTRASHRNISLSLLQMWPYAYSLNSSFSYILKISRSQVSHCFALLPQPWYRCW